jgi:V/A-type H+-transporting ATPase subunit E
MTGLEKILKAIEDEAQAGADKVLSEAYKQAEEILAAARLDAENRCNQIAEKSAADVKNIISRAESAAVLQEKKILLNAKQQIIGDIIAKARNSLAALPDSEFTDTILAMVKKYAHNKPGKILFSASDRNRLPQDFNDRLKSALSDKPAAALTLAGEAADIDGGFLLVYGDIEENCSFDALFSASKEVMQDKVNSLLFE